MRRENNIDISTNMSHIMLMFKNNSKRVDPKTMVYLHNGILRSREKERAYTLATAWMEL